MKTKTLLIGLSLTFSLIAAPVLAGTTTAHADAPGQQPLGINRMKKNYRQQRMNHFDIAKKLSGMKHIKHVKKFR